MARSPIKIKPANRGKYTARAKANGRSVQAQASTDLKPGSKGETVLVDVLLVEFERIRANEDEVLRPVDVGILRTADTQVIHQKICDLFLNLRVFDEPEILVRRNWTFIAFLKDRLNAVICD